MKFVLNDGSRAHGVGDEKIKAITKTLHIDNLSIFTCALLEQNFRFSEMLGSQLQAFCANGASQLRWRSRLMKDPFVHQRNAVAPFCFVEIWSCDDDG